MAETDSGVNDRGTVILFIKDVWFVELHNFCGLINE